MQRETPHASVTCFSLDYKVKLGEDTPKFHCIGGNLKCVRESNFWIFREFGSIYE